MSDLGPDDWTLDALCGQTYPDLWFPQVTATDEQRHAAVRICHDCPVQAQCLHAAMRLEQGMGRTSRFGIWGGLTPTQRAAMDAAHIKTVEEVTS